VLINGVDMNITLTRAPESFYLLAPSDDNKVRIKILDATLFISQAELKPPLLLADDNGLAMKRKAHYPLTHIQMKTFTASFGAQLITMDDAFLGTFPEMIRVSFFINGVSVGSASANHPTFNIMI